MTVETALVLPMLFLASVCILYMFVVMGKQMHAKITLYEAAHTLAVAAYATDGEDTEDNYIELTVPIYTKLPINYFAEKSFWITESVKLRKWTGYDPDEAKEAGDEEMVFITETGSVYHRNRECSYLNPSIRTVSKESLSLLRNKSGHIYYECKACKNKKTSSQSVYITTYGESYHYDVNCEGLKRTVYCVPISEVGSRGPCSKCG